MRWWRNSGARDRRRTYAWRARWSACSLDSARPGDGRVLERRRSGGLLKAFQQRLTAIEHVDFFAAAGRDHVAALLSQFEARVSQSRRTASTPPAGNADAQRYQGRLWVTRPRPGVDRMACAWLIRRFIDPDARFGFVTDRATASADAIPFDMFGVEFTHRGDHCTFETLCAVFGIADAAVNRIAAIVHDVDLKDGRFSPVEGPTVAMVIGGLQLAYADDDELLAQGMVLFEALYRSTEHATGPTGPRPVAAKTPRQRSTSQARPRRRS